MMPPAYAHAGQRASCERCGTYACPPCREHLHELCHREPCCCECEEVL